MLWFVAFPAKALCKPEHATGSQPQLDDEAGTGAAQEAVQDLDAPSSTDNLPTDVTRNVNAL
jgi:hypothetical protein